MGESTRILIVEDLPPDAELAIREIRKSLANCVFRRVETESDYLNALEKFDPDLILSDYHLPSFNGMDALKLALERAPLTPVIIFTGSLSEDIAVDCMKAGAVNYIIKENIKRLGLAVVHALEEKKVRIERDQAEKDLHESVMRYRTLVNKIPAIVYIDDLTAQPARTKYISPQVESMFEFTPEEWIKGGFELWKERIHPDDRERVMSDYQHCTKTKQGLDCEYRIISRSGKVLWVHDQSTILMDQKGWPFESHGIVYDITERKQVEEKLHLQGAALEAAANTIVITDRAGIIQWANPAFGTLTGFDPKEATGKNPRELVKSGKQDQAFYKNLWDTILSGKVWQGELANRRKDGKHYDEEMTITPLYDQRGEISHFIAIEQDITGRKQAEQQIAEQLQRLQALHTVDRAIASSFDLSITIGTLLEQLTSQLRIDAASICLFDKYMLTLEHLTSVGFYSNSAHGAKSKIAESLAGRAVIERQAVHIPDLSGADIDPVNAFRYRSEKFVSYYAAPLISKGQIRGVMEIFQRAPLELTPEWLDFMETLAEQAAIAIDISRLFGDLQKSNMELALAYDATIEGWSRALDLRDKDTEGHTLRVTELAMQLADRMGIGKEKQINLRRGALLHDIGKLGVPDTILFKPGKLTDEEWVIMRQHPTLAYNMLLPLDHLKLLLDVPYCHHEKWDSTGYPRGLKGEQIPLDARIFAVVDVWDAITSDRPYRSAWSKEQALDYIREQSGKYFDPQIVDVFLNMITNS